MKEAPIYISILSLIIWNLIQFRMIAKLDKRQNSMKDEIARDLWWIWETINQK